MLKVIVIIVIAVALIAVGIFSGFIPLEITGSEDYNTGISRSSLHNCITEIKKGGVHDILFGKVGGWAGNVPLEKDNDGEWIPDELIVTPFNNNPVVTAMKPGSKSIAVTCQGTLGYGGVSTIYWVPEWGWYEVDYTTNGVTWTNIINTKNDQINQDMVTLFTGPQTKQKYYREDPGFEIRHPFYPTPCYEYKILKTIAFQITGTFTGAIRVKQQTEFSAVLGALHDTMTMSIDYAYLASGKGDVEIVNDQTVYEEGETVMFEVDTGFSGQTQGGNYVSQGWELKIYDSAGNLRLTWDIDDDKRGTRHDHSGNLLNYKIPYNVYRSDGKNRWKAVLTNTLFDQDEEIFFAIGEGMREQAPSIPTISFNQDEYRLGDTVTVTLTSWPNPEGRNKVDSFLVNAIYGKDGVDYVDTYHTKNIRATDNEATFSFKVSKGDLYVTVEAWAFDAPEDEGGIPSEKATASIWIKDKESQPVDFDWLGVLIAIAIFIVFGIIALFVPGWPVKLIVLIIGAILAAFVYVYFFTSLI